MKHLIVAAVVAVLSLGFAQAPIRSVEPTQEVVAAFGEVKQAIQESVGAMLVCGRLNTFWVRGKLEQAGPLAEKVINRLGWQIIDYGQLNKSYALILDNAPEVKTAIALGGILPTGDGNSYFYLTQCHMHGGDQSARR